jgi:hypothetical protein
MNVAIALLFASIVLQNIICALDVVELLLMTAKSNFMKEYEERIEQFNNI